MGRERPARRDRAPLPPGFGTIWTSVAIDLVGWGIVLPILPLYAEEFTDSPAVIGLLVASFSVMQLVFAPVWGRVSDQIGRKPVLIVSLAGTAVGSLLMGVAWSLPILFLGRIVDGISGGSISAAHAAVTDVAPADQRARLLGLLSAAFGLGFVAGPAIGALAALGGAHVPFFVAAAIAAANAIVAVRRLPETNPGGGQAPAVEHGADAVGPASALPAGTPADPRRLHRHTGFTAFEATFALFGERRFDLTIAGTGAVFAVVGLSLAAFQGGVVHLVVSRLGELATIRLGLALDAGGFLVLAGATTWPVLALALALVTAGQGLLAPALTSLVAGRAHRDRRGSTLGIQQSASALARVVGPIAGGLLFEHVGVAAPYAMAAALALVAAGATVALPQRSASTV